MLQHRWDRHVLVVSCFFFFNDTATTEIYTLSLHDALPIYSCRSYAIRIKVRWENGKKAKNRSEEHTSELQSRLHLVCRLLLEKKKCLLPVGLGSRLRVQRVGGGLLFSGDEDCAFFF